MNPVVILAVVGAVGFIAYRLLSQKVEKQEGAKDPALEALDKFANDLLNKIPKVITWFDTEVPEAFGYEGYDTLKEHAYAANEIFNWRRSAPLTCDQVISVLNGLKGGWALISNPRKNGSGWTEPVLANYLNHVLKIPVRQTDSRTKPYQFAGNVETWAQLLASASARPEFRAGTLSVPMTPAGWAPDQPKDWQNAPSLAAKGPHEIPCFPSLRIYRRGTTAPVVFVTTYPAHTYLYVRTLTPHSSGWLTGEHSLVEYFTPENQALIWAAMMFGDKNQAFQGWNDKYTIKKAYWTE